KEKPQQKGISSVGYNSSNSLEVNASKTLATLGTGNVTVKDVDNSDELDRLNRDTTAVNKDLYSSSTGTKVDATLDTRLLTEDGREQIAKEFEQLADNVDTLNRYLKDNLGDNKLTEDKKIAIQNDINSLGKEEALAKALKEQGVSEEDIKKVLDNENIQKLFGNEIVNNTSTLNEIVVTPTKDLQDYLLNTAQGINELVNIVGEDKVAGAIFVTQILLQGTLATAKGLVSDEVNNYLTSGVKNSLSEYIADKYFGINEEAWNINQQNAIKNISDLSSGFAIDTLISGGAFGIIKGASKLGSANDGLVNSSTIDSPVFNNSTNTNGNSITTPNQTAKDYVNENNSYIDPFTNEMKLYDGKLSADHIYPKSEIVKLDGFSDLSKQQQAQVLNDLKNFQGLPQNINASKGKKMGCEFQNCLGEKVDLQYQIDLQKKQDYIKNYLQTKINEMSNKNGN
ncbi:hypothetical protein CRU92_12665, partial [Arcobacter sp. FW59]